MSTVNTKTTIRGSSASINDLLQLRFEAQALQVAAKARARSPFVGLINSRFKGRGINFAEVRHYQPGDDIRAIDWRVTARTGKTHTKLFEEERERPVMFLTDLGPNMYFGSKRAFKSVVAAEAAALLAWSALAQGDKVGAVVFDGSEHHEIRPKRSKSCVLQLLHHLAEMTARAPSAQAQENRLNWVLEHARRVCKPGTLVFLLSDFSDPIESYKRHLHLCAQHTEIVAIQITDPMEKELPSSGWYHIGKAQQTASVYTGGKTQRLNYQQQFAAQREILANELAKVAIPLLQLSTHEAVLEPLRQQMARKR